MEQEDGGGSGKKQRRITETRTGLRGRAAGQPDWKVRKGEHGQGCTDRDGRTTVVRDMANRETRTVMRRDESADWETDENGLTVHG